MPMNNAASQNIFTEGQDEDYTLPVYHYLLVCWPVSPNIQYAVNGRLETAAAHPG